MFQFLEIKEFIGVVNCGGLFLQNDKIVVIIRHGFFLKNEQVRVINPRGLLLQTVNANVINPHCLFLKMRKLVLLIVVIYF